MANATTGSSSREAKCVDLLRDRLGDCVAVAMAAVSPATGAFSWSAGASPDGRPVTTGTPMYGASITKQFFAAIVGQATLAGRLPLNSSVGRILPSLPAWAEQVQVRHLIHHTAGLPPTAQLLSALHVHDEAALDNDLVLRGLCQLAETHELPGRVFAYSNIGYVLL